MNYSSPYPIPRFGSAGETDLQLELREEMRTSLRLFAEGLPPLPAPSAPDLRVCPDCAEEIHAAARVCKHCGLRFAQPSDQLELA